ncbi:Unusual floral organs-like protein [Zostera marina]|uniref:Unusual floral organs-like protein n=1 Tax=Zostera marina TaxID=29655 RepID=A0A0K9NSV8_ZOSMR|nr:Unusual floral organs-like protein [Zostera marina]
MSIYPSLPVSNPNIYFILFSEQSKYVSYNPYDDRWVQLPLPDAICGPICSEWIHASGGCHIIVERTDSSMLVCNFFTGQYRFLPPMLSLRHVPYVIALIEDVTTFGDYGIVAVSTQNQIRSQVYFSSTGKWVIKGNFPGQFAMVSNSAWLNEELYCLSCAPPYCLIMFTPSTGHFSPVDVGMPLTSLTCPHILAHNGELYLVGGLEELGDISRIGIWELDWKEKNWKSIVFMPEGLFRRFVGIEMNRFVTVDRKGVVCFCNITTYNLIMFDLSKMRWWRPVPCPFKVRKNTRSWLGHVVEPHIQVLLGACSD